MMKDRPPSDARSIGGPSDAKLASSLPAFHSLYYSLSLSLSPLTPSLSLSLSPGRPTPSPSPALPHTRRRLAPCNAHTRARTHFYTQSTQYACEKKTVLWCGWLVHARPGRHALCAAPTHTTGTGAGTEGARGRRPRWRRACVQKCVGVCVWRLCVWPVAAFFFSAVPFSLPLTFYSPSPLVLHVCRVISTQGDCVSVWPHCADTGDGRVCKNASV